MTENKNKNPLWNAYFKADQFLVDRANEAVKAWNWTTGRTRAELADVLNVANSFFDFYSGANNVNIFIDAGYILAFHFNSHRKDKLEAKAQDIICPSVDLNNKISSVAGPTLLLLGANTIPGESTIETNYQLNGTGSLLLGVAHYIMRADYQKPRKDCVRRGLEKLAEIVQKQPALETARGEVYAGGLI